MQPRIVPASIIYPIYLYEQSKAEKDSAITRTLYNGIATGVQYVKDTINNPLKSAPPKVDIRKKECKDLIFLASNIKPENIVETLKNITKEADALQKKELKRFEINQKISDFTQCMHFVRTLPLYNFLYRGLKPGEFKNDNEFSKKIFEAREKLKKNLSNKLEEIDNAQEAGGTLDQILKLEEKAYEFRYHLAYLGDKDSLKCPTIREALFPSRFYSIDPLNPKRPKPAFPYILHHNFPIIYIKRIYEKQGISSQLAGKNDDEIMAHFEEYATQQMEIIYKKEEELQNLEQKKQEAKKMLDDTSAKLPETSSTLGNLLSRFYSYNGTTSISNTPTSTGLPRQNGESKDLDTRPITLSPLQVNFDKKDIPILERTNSESDLTGNITPTQEKLFAEKKNENKSPNKHTDKNQNSSMREDNNADSTAPSPTNFRNAR